MRIIGIQLIIAVAFVAISCSEEEGGNDNISNVEIIDTTVLVDEIDVFEQKYADLLDVKCDCDTDVEFDISGEGDQSPFEILLDGKPEDCYSWSGHVVSFNPENNHFLLDSLEDWDEYEEVEQVEFEPGWNKKVVVDKGSVYKWPDTESELVYDFTFESTQELAACFGKWVKISFWNQTTEEKQEGWVLKN